MKAVLLNGSPRNGNTKAAIDIVAASLSEYKAADEVEVLNVADLKIAGCMGCGACHEGSGCAIDDDGVTVGEKVAEADIVIFGTPVYWWGVTSQIKAAIDRMYAQGEKLSAVKGKKIGVIAVGEAELDDPEYGLISGQFDCICEYLGWEKVLDKPISAGEADDLIKNLKTIEELKRVGELFR